MKSKHPPSFRGDLAFAALSAAVVLFSSGCANSPKWGAWSERPSPEQVEAAIGTRPETYIYFTAYQVYQEPHSNKYVYQENGKWVHSYDLPEGVSANHLHGSHSIAVALNDAPERRHDAVKQAYPNYSDPVPSTIATNPTTPASIAAAR